MSLLILDEECILRHEWERAKDGFWYCPLCQPEELAAANARGVPKRRKFSAAVWRQEYK